MTEPLRLSGASVGAWVAAMQGAVSALRLNQHFPPWQRLAAHLAAIAHAGEVRLDRTSGLPVPSEWVRVRLERDMADAVLSDLAAVEPGALDVAHRSQWEARRRYHAELSTLEPLPARDVHIALRHVDGDRASYAVRVDRFDVATATVARYCLVVRDRVGRNVSPGELELRAGERFSHRLAMLSTQDAAVAFAVLRDGDGLEVDEVVRGVVGPASYPPSRPDHGCGPEAVRRLRLSGPAVTACLERASLDVAGGRIDDPLADSVVVPVEGSTRQPFGLSRQRKWAVPAADVEPVKSWLRSKGSRNLVYAY